MTDNADAQQQAPVAATTASETDTPVPVPADTPPQSAAPTTDDKPSASPSSQPAVVLPPKSSAKAGKSSARRTKARPRRRAAASDEEDSDAGGGDGHSSDSSLTDASSASEDEPDDEDVDAEKDQNKSAPAFEDVSSLTPAGWTEGVDAASSAELTFDESNRGESGRGRGSVRGRGGRGRGGAAGQQRELTEEEKARIEEAKKKRKEKVKAKRAELKETKRKNRESKAAEGVEAEITDAKKAAPAPAPPATTKEGKAKGKKKPDGPIRADSGVSALVASTSALTLEDPSTPAVDIPDPIKEESAVEATSSAPSNAPRAKSNSRDAYTQRLAADPKFTPRVGGFWTHDQRLYDAGPVGEGAYSGLRQMSEYWRGRGGARGMPRGGFRGRGRGFPQGPFAPGGFAHRQASSEELTTTKSLEGKEVEASDEPVLAMDRIEAELAKKQIRPPPPADETAPAPPRDNKWGHEAYEAQQTEDTRRTTMSIRGAFRARGRGRGGFAPRGGHFAGPVRPADLPTPQSTPGQSHATVPKVAAEPLKQAQAPSSAPAPSTAPPAASTAEQQSTHPDADALLDDGRHAFTIKLPGSDKTVEVSVPATTESAGVPQQDTSSLKSPEVPAAATANGQAILYSSPAPSAVVEAQTQAPHTQGVPIVNGSLSSSLAPAPIFHPASIPHPHSQPSPFPTASESGSISSAGQFAPAPIVPAGMGYGANGYAGGMSSGVDYHQGQDGQSRGYYPNGVSAGNAPRGYATHQHQQNFYPQQQPYPQEQFQPHHQSRGSFSGPPQYYGQPPSTGGYSDGRDSPFNGSPSVYGMPQPVPASSSAGGQLGYFAPARQGSKVSIRPPAPGQSAGKGKSNLNASTPAFASLNNQQQQMYLSAQAQAQAQAQMQSQGQAQYYSQHYNPYTAQQLQLQAAQAQAEGGYEGQQQAYYPNMGVGVGSGGAGAYGWEGQGGGQGQGAMAGYGYQGEYGY